MTIDTIRDQLRGVAVGLLTPFDDSYEVEYDKLEDNAQTLYNKGIRTFLAAANISEYHSLSHEERVNVAKSSVTSLSDDVCILAGVGGSTPAAIDLIRDYEQNGVDAMMIMPPGHTYLHEEGLLDYYRELDAVTDKPLIPYVRGFDPSVEFLEGLTRIDGVIGIKYALKDPVKLGAAIGSGADDVVWINGLAEPYAVAYWAEGTEGFSAGVSNFRPEVGLALFDALKQEEWQRARDLRNICLPYQKYRDETGENNTIPGALSVPAIKEGLELAGLYGGNVRDPIRPLTPTQKERAAALYDQLNTHIDHLIE